MTHRTPASLRSAPAFYVVPDSDSDSEDHSPNPKKPTKLKLRPRKLDFSSSSAPTPMRIDDDDEEKRYVKATATFAPPPKSTFNPPRQTKVVHLGSDDDEDDDVEVLVPATPIEQEEDDRLGELWSEQLHDLRLLEKQLPALVKDPIERARIMAIRPAEQRLLHLSLVRSADFNSRIPLHRPEDDRLDDLAGPGERERLRILEHQLPVGHPDLAIKPAARRYERLMANLRMGTLTIDLKYEKGLFEDYPRLCSGKPQRILFPPRPGQTDPFLVCTLPTKAGGDKQVIPETQEPASDDPKDKLSELSAVQVGLLRDLEALLPPGHAALKIRPAKERLRHLFNHLSLDEDARPFFPVWKPADEYSIPETQALVDDVCDEDDYIEKHYVYADDLSEANKRKDDPLISCYYVKERNNMGYPFTVTLRHRDIDPTTHFIFASSTSDVKLALKADEWSPVVKKKKTTVRKPPTKGPDGLTSRQRAERRALARGCSWTKWN
jgi:hypothetical protein